MYFCCGCRWFYCKIGAALLLLYALGHFAAIGRDLGWMPPPQDMTHVTDSPRKKHPDGPLVLKDGILSSEGDAEGKAGKGGAKKLVKAVLMERPMTMMEGEEEEEDGFQIKEEEKDGKKQQRHKLPISEQFLNKFRQSAKLVHKRRSLPNGFVLFALLNRAYLDLTLNWICNIYALPPGQKNNSTGGGGKEKGGKNSKKNEAEGGNVDGLKAILLVALDGGEMCKEVKRSWTQVTCLSLFEKQKKAATQLDADEQKAYNEALSWGRARYVHILTARANLMAALAEAKVPFVVAESDAVWLRNPFPELFAKADLVEDAHLVMPLNSASRGSTKGERFAFDPMVVFANNASRRALQEMRRVLNRERNMMDQALLNQLCSQQYAGLVCREFTPEQIADGAWFKLSESERMRAAEEVGYWPFVVNNNFYVGVHNKMARQAINGLWFLSAKQKQCNLSKAKRILSKYSEKPPA